jgi:predicted nucleotide-binding protein (sugar kinase/HSP70/actin superfamily)
MVQVLGVGRYRGRIEQCPGGDVFQLRCAIYPTFRLNKKLKKEIGQAITSNVMAWKTYPGRPYCSKGKRKKRRGTENFNDDPRVQMAKKMSKNMSKNMSISIGEICATLKSSRASSFLYLGI